MASNEFSGYDLNWVEDSSDDLNCLICLCVARDPQQHLGDDTNECGKIFCSDCINKHLRSKTTCPNCQQNICLDNATRRNLFKDSKSARQIRCLKVKCDHQTNGCDWTGELGSLETHLQSCDYVLLPCTNQCKIKSVVSKFLRKDLNNHLANDCPRRQYECPHCQVTGEHQERTTKHLETCPKVKVDCPNNDCQDMVARCDVKVHQSKCSYESVSCKYAAVGCGEKPLRKALTKHEENDQLHFRITRDKVLEHVQRIALLEAEARANTKLQDGTNVHTEWMRSMTSVTRTLKLCDYQEHKLTKEEFYTPPFYTSSNGYKMCLSVYANGDGVGAGTHVSVYACLMKGDHDDTLTWPFTGSSVTIELLNQLEDKNHHKHTTTFPADDEVSQRVVDSDSERGTGWGSQEFISHADLDYDASANTQYLKNDTLVFRFTVRVPHLFEHT